MLSEQLYVRELHLPYSRRQRFCRRPRARPPTAAQSMRIERELRRKTASWPLRLEYTALNTWRINSRDCPYFPPARRPLCFRDRAFNLSFHVGVNAWHHSASCCQYGASNASSFPLRSGKLSSNRCFPVVFNAAADFSSRPRMQLPLRFLDQHIRHRLSAHSPTRAPVRHRGANADQRYL